MLANQSFLLPSSEAFLCPDNGFTKRKRRPAGTPDPDAEVVYLTPEMLMESDRYVCEICNQSFQREQNLQMHRRRHKVPWKLLKRDKQEVKKRVYVCPEATCLHHDPSHALGDLVGIKKHFRRKHSNQKQFVCDKCAKGYAVQSDYKAHLKICGTKGHSCDCGRVFSRVESFIEHQDTCKAQNTGFEPQAPTLPWMQRVSSSSASFSGNSNFTTNPIPESLMPKPTKDSSSFNHNLDLGLELFSSNLSLSNKSSSSLNSFLQQNHGQENEYRQSCSRYNDAPWNGYYNQRESAINQEPTTMIACRLKSDASQLLKMAMEQKTLAERKRQEAKCLIELAKQDMTNARRMREQVVAQLNTAHHSATFGDHCSTSLSSSLGQVTCHACNKAFQTVSEEPAHGKAFPAHHHLVNNGSKGKESFLLWANDLNLFRMN